MYIRCNELRLFWAKAFPLLLLLIAALGTSLVMNNYGRDSNSFLPQRRADALQSQWFLQLFFKDVLKVFIKIIYLAYGP